MIKKIICVFLLFQITICWGQNTSSINSKEPFLNGVHSDNLKILIPWAIDFSELHRYGDPSVMKDSKHKNQIFVIWDSLKILSGILVNLKVQKVKKVLNEKKLQPLGFLNFTTDSIGINELTNFFVKYTNNPGFFDKRKKSTSRRWIVNKCLVHVGYGKRYGYFMWVSKNNHP